MHKTDKDNMESTGNNTLVLDEIKIEANVLYDASSSLNKP